MVMGIRNFFVPINSQLVWRERVKRFAKPKVLISAFLATSAFYCFVIGRDRYTSVSEFVIQQAAPLDGAAASVTAGATAPQVLTSLVDGQYSKFISMADIKKRPFLTQESLSGYQIDFPDIRTGLVQIVRSEAAYFIDINYLWLLSP